MKTVELSVAGGQTRARVALDVGCNLFSWSIDGRELLYAPDGFGDSPATFYAGGTPILFPAVGRTWDRSVAPPVAERYTVHGASGDCRMPIHGLGPLGAWHVVDTERTDLVSRLACRFEYSAEVARRHYPFTLELTQEFTLRAEGVEFRATLRNPGPAPAPYAFGYHPYLRLVSGQAVLDIPCRRQLDLIPDLLIPAGAQTRPATFPLELSAASECDAVYALRTDGWACLTDRQAGYQIAMGTGDNAACFVVYSAAGAPFVCVEPWTCPPGTFSELRRPDWPTTAGMPVLAAGKAHTFRMDLAYRRLPPPPVGGARHSAGLEP